MDTISINIDVKHCQGEIQIETLKMLINNIKSEFGFCYVDFLSMNTQYNFTLKVSYPRYYKGINAYLVNSSNEVLRVNQNLVIQLNILFHNIGIINYTINLIRVDIPFTYEKPSNLTFNDYFEVFRLLCISYNNTKQSKKQKKISTTGIIGMITREIETVNFTNSSGNIEVCIYNQYLNILRKTSNLQMMNQYIQFYPDLVNRIRIEVRKRIQRKEFTPYEFTNFNILEEYLPQHKNFLLKYLFNKNVFDTIKNDFIYQLDNSYKLYLQNHGRINYESWVLENKSLIIDYSIIREVLVRNIKNKKTLENAITSVRRILERINPMYKDVFKSIKDIKNSIKQYSPSYQIQDENLNGSVLNNEMIFSVFNNNNYTNDENLSNFELQQLEQEVAYQEMCEQLESTFNQEN